MNTLPLLRPYQKYENPKLGLFRCCTGESRLNIGLIYEQKELEIIGENDIWYITKLIIHEDHFTDSPTYKQKFLSPIGIHKDYFIKWIENQLTINF